MTEIDYILPMTYSKLLRHDRNRIELMQMLEIVQCT